MKYAIQFDNESLYRFAPNGLSPSYWHVNLLISYTISGITARTRFDGDLGCDMSDIETNLCPYPSLNFLFATYSPLRFGKRTCNEKALTTESFSNIYFYLHINNVYSRGKIFGQFNSSVVNLWDMGEFVSIDTTVGEYICCSLIYRGRECSPLKVSQACAAIHKHVKFGNLFTESFFLNVLPSMSALDANRV